MSLETWIATLRFAHIGASLLLFGALAFPLYAGRECESLACATERALASIALVSGVAWIAAMAAMVGGEGALTNQALLSAIFLNTDFGHAWIAHAALTALVLALAFSGASRHAHLGAAAAAVQLASTTLIGHGASLEGAEGAVLMLARTAHTLAAGAWIGGAYALQHCLRRCDHASGQAILARFSRAGFAWVAVLALSGFATLRLVTQSWCPNLDARYGLLIAGKLALAAALVCVAALNRVFASSPQRRALLYATIIAEHVLFAAIVLAAATLSGLDPHG